MGNDSGPQEDTAPSSPDWVGQLSRYLRNETQVEAIRLDPVDGSVSFATIGETDMSALEQRLQSLIRSLDKDLLKRGKGTFTTRDGISVLTQDNETLFEKSSCPTAPTLWRWRTFEWPGPEELEDRSREEWQWLAMQAAICGIGLVTAWGLQRFTVLPGIVPIVFYVIAMIAGGWDAACDAFGKLRQRQLDIHFLMLAVALGATAIGAWAEGALLLFLFSASGAMEHYALHRTHREINSLTKSTPRTANVIHQDGTTEERQVSLLRPGDKLLVKPDEVFSVDGEILKGETAVDESNLTGEAHPVDKSVGDPVYSGTLNLWGQTTVLCSRPVSESALSRIIDLIQRAQHLRAPSQRFTDRFGTRYTYFILGFTLVMFLVWWLGFQLPPFHNTFETKSAFYRAMTLLVVASPCALVLSIPSAILAAIAWGARHGILFRGGAAIEKLGEIDTVALDKTGTLTTGDLSVQSVESFPSGFEDTITQIAFSLESFSNHPIARAITVYGKRHGLTPSEISGFQSITGMGLRGIIDDKKTFLGRRALLGKAEVMGDWVKDVPDPPPDQNEVWVVNENLLGRILLRDEIRTASRPVLDALKKRGVRVLMLTGDRRASAETVARDLGVEDVRAGLHPEDKVEAIRELSQAGRRVAMVGDGVNDAPSLAAAHVSVAMGGRGSDAALEQADLVLMKDRIDKLLTALRLSHSARRVVRQNLGISLATVILMVGAALFGMVPLTIGVIAHEGSTVLVCLNSLRLLFLKDEEQFLP